MNNWYERSIMIGELTSKALGAKKALCQSSTVLQPIADDCSNLQITYSWSIDHLSTHLHAVDRITRYVQLMISDMYLQISPTYRPTYRNFSSQSQIFFSQKCIHFPPISVIYDEQKWQVEKLKK